MSDIKQSDVLAYFQRVREPKPIPSDAVSSLADSSDKLVEDFVPGHYFVADTFTFGAALADGEGDNEVSSKSTGSFGRWRALKVGQSIPDPPFRIKPEEVAITRMIDAASPLLLSHCLESKPFEKAVIVKRSRNGVSGLLSGILRLEFTTVWIKMVEWEDGDAVIETLRFKFDKVDVKYVQRKPDGSVGSTWPCGWTSPLADPPNG